MEIKDLRYFVAVYEARGFSRAARKLGTVQSNVSARIRNLERGLGTDLFIRCYRHIAPTSKGDQLYQYANRVIASVDHTERALKTPNAA